MSTPVPGELTDADWDSVDRRFWLAMLRLRREHENAVAERDSATGARARLQRDYDAVCAELHQALAKGNAALTELEEKLAGTRAEVASLEQQLFEVHQKKEEAIASVAILENAEPRTVEDEREEAGVHYQAALDELEDAQRALETMKAERDDVRAERDRALAQAAAKDEELAALRAELVKSRQKGPAQTTLPAPAPVEVGNTPMEKLVPPPEPAPEPPIDEDKDPNWLTPLPVGGLVYAVYGAYSSRVLAGNACRHTAAKFCFS